MTGPASPIPDATFVDTSAWYAYLNRSDANHRQAVSQLAARSGTRLVTTTYVTSECSRLANLYHSQVAIQFTWHLWRGDFAEVVEPDPEVQRSAWQVFRSARRIGLSFTDCVSIAFIRRYYVADAIAYGIMSGYLPGGTGGGWPGEMTAG
jgi:predicted nucleic acid-binding protein